MYIIYLFHSGTDGFLCIFQFFMLLSSLLTTPDMIIRHCWEAKNDTVFISIIFGLLNNLLKKWNETEAGMEESLVLYSFFIFAFLTE